MIEPLHHLSDMEIEIRSARAEDAEALARLSGQLGYPASAEETAERVRGVLAREDSAVLVATEPGGEVVGWLQATKLDTLTDGPSAHMIGLVVDDRYRGQRVGRRLLARAEEWARDQGCGKIVVRSRLGRERAHAFYEGLGYEHFKTQRAFRRRL